MPKMKTKSAVKKRFRLTNKGRIKRARAGHNHNLSCKPSHRGMRLRQMTMVDGTNEKQIKRMIVG